MKTLKQLKAERDAADAALDAAYIAVKDAAKAKRKRKVKA